MVSLANSPDLNTIENLWAIIKRVVYHGGKQCSSLAELWKAIEDAAALVTLAEILKPTSSVASRIVKIIKNGGAHVFA